MSVIALLYFHVTDKEAEARRGEVTWPHVSQRRVTRKPSSLDIVLPPPSLSAGRSWVAPLPCKVHSILGGALSSPQLPPNPTQSPVEPSYPVPQDGSRSADRGLPSLAPASFPSPSRPPSLDTSSGQGQLRRAPGGGLTRWRGAGPFPPYFLHDEAFLSITPPGGHRK